MLEFVELYPPMIVRCRKAALAAWLSVSTLLLPNVVLAEDARSHESGYGFYKLGVGISTFRFGGKEPSDVFVMALEFETYNPRSPWYRAQFAQFEGYRWNFIPVGMALRYFGVKGNSSWIDYGMFLQNIMVAARGMGLHTCPQAAFAPYHRIIREQMNIPEDETVICGMSLGAIDPDAPENALATEREPVEAFTTFIDF